MKFTDCNIFKDGRFVFGDIAADDGVFISVEIKDEAEQPGRPYLIPGLVDIHTHGCKGYDFSDGDPEAIAPMADFYASHGVTSFCPTTMTLPYEVLDKAFRAVQAYAESGKGSGARPAGINMEGPYFSEAKKGAQNGAYLKLPDIEGFRKLYENCGGMISLVDIAPELDGACDFIREASRMCTVSVAHTAAGYDEAKAAFDAGADHLTHLYNAMPGIHHREPGVIGAASENKKVFAELICDGYHVHPSAVRMAFELFKDRVCLVSDSLRCAGMPDGEYELGGQPVFLKDGVARLAEGNIAGSSANLFDCMKNAIRFGIPAEKAIEAATVNPAKSIRMADRIGAIAEGLKADLLVCSGELELQEVYIGGKKWVKSS